MWINCVYTGFTSILDILSVFMDIFDKIWIPCASPYLEHSKGFPRDSPAKGFPNDIIGFPIPDDIMGAGSHVTKHKQ